MLPYVVDALYRCLLLGVVLDRHLPIVTLSPLKHESDEMLGLAHPHRIVLPPKRTGLHVIILDDHGARAK